MAMLLDPETLDWKSGLAHSLFHQERFSDAIALCDELIAEHSERAELWLAQANAYLGREDLTRAAENFEMVDELGGSTVASLQKLGDIYVEEGLFDLAVDAYRRAMAMDESGDPARATLAAQVMMARGAAEQTRELLAGIEERYADDLTATQQKDLLALRARLAVAEGATDEEAEVLEQIVELDPLDGEALILLGRHARRTGDPERAVFYFERAANVEGFEAEAKLRHAQLLVSQSRYAEALPLLRRAQSLEPRDNVQDFLEQVERIAQSR